MIHVAICDDSAQDIEIISYKVEQALKNHFEMEYTITCLDNLADLQVHLEIGTVDIVFLDIMVRDENAMDWSIEHIRNRRAQIIFLTSFPQCAYNISEANCCYYIVKSRLTQETVTRALQRALRELTKKEPNLTTVKSGNKNHIINYQDVLYIETFNNSITLHLENGSDITVYSSLKDYADKLPPNFLRCHKCYMVNMNRITGYEPHKFIMAYTQAIPIPPKKYKSVIKTYQNYLMHL